MAATSYAARLKPRHEKGGGLGNPECLDSSPVEALKAFQVAELLKAAKQAGRAAVFLTGAGISTSAGVADFRGPNGVWTAEKAGKPPPPSADFDQAHPTATHMALVALVESGYAQLVVSQNVDGLHLRSGLERSKLAELHGNIFMEKCEKCGKEYFREFDVGGMSFQPTGRMCDMRGCKGRLIDQILDWDDALPEDQLTLAEDVLDKCDLSICLGTSLRIKPASELPLIPLKRRGKLVICNLQKTPKDRRASVSSRSHVDGFWIKVMSLLDVPIKPSVRHVHLKAGEFKDDKAQKRMAGLWSSAGKQWPVPLIRTATITAVFEGGEEHTGTATSPPFCIEIPGSGKAVARIEAEIYSTISRGEGIVRTVVELGGETEKDLSVEVYRMEFEGQDADGRALRAKEILEQMALAPARKKKDTEELEPRERGQPLGKGWVQCGYACCSKWGRVSKSRPKVEGETWYCRRRCADAAVAPPPVKDESVDDSEEDSDD